MKPPRWRQPDQERDGRRGRVVTSPVGVRPAPLPVETAPLEVDEDLDSNVGARARELLRELADDLTPPPVDTNNLPRVPTTGEAWDHATHVNRRVLDLLSVIAKSSGAGMTVGDEIKKLRRGRTVSIGISIGSLITAAGCALALARALVGHGETEGEQRARDHYIDQQLERCIDRLDHLDGRRSEADPAPTLFTTRTP